MLINNLNLKKNLIVIIGGIGVFFIFAQCRLVEKNRMVDFTDMKGFIDSGIIWNPDVDNYVKGIAASEGLKNGDFTLGFAHWGRVESKNNYLLDTQEYVSAPAAVRFDIKEFPCSLYYTQTEVARKFDFLPWDYRFGEVWLPVKKGEKVTLSCYIKGLGPTVYINSLKKSGCGCVLARHMETKFSDVFRKIELSAVIPEDCRAIGIEITVNSNQEGNGSHRYLLLDDVSLLVK